MTKDDAIASLHDAVKSHLGKIADNMMGDALGTDFAMNSAVTRYSIGLHNTRVFADRAAKVIETEFKS